jgi:hypothetical protein
MISISFHGFTDARAIVLQEGATWFGVLYLKSENGHIELYGERAPTKKEALDIMFKMAAKIGSAVTMLQMEESLDYPLGKTL